jgi:prepilin-type N-terminal cleavage/methylation domain-containing protein
MTTHTNQIKFYSGFSLVEMSIVLAIVALLLGGLLPTISSQMEQQRRNETRKQLADIQQALLGFAIMNKRLPCPMPATITNPADANYGLAATSCSPSVEGYLPWKTLGVSEIDAWGSKRTSTSSPWTGYWRYRTDQNFSNAGTPITLTTNSSALDALTIVDINWVSLTSATERPIAIVYSTGPDLTPNGKNALPFQVTNAVYQSDVPGKNPDLTNFDDILIWISRPQLFNRMVAAGTLP